MKRLLTFTAVCLLAVTAVAQDYPIQGVPFTSVTLNDNFWAPRLKVHREVTIPIALYQCYNTGRVDNFLKAGRLKEGDFGTEYTFDDTDIYKIIEGASYSLQTCPDKELEAHLDALIYYIGRAQEPDGYLYTARTINPDPAHLHQWVGAERWVKDPDLSHELYNCGHLYEAAAAHFRATGKTTLLDIAVKNADLLVHDFGPGKLELEPGHQIVEMGLAKLYGVTGKREYLELAKFFLDARGKKNRKEYSQNHLPVVEQETAVGHAVRAGYMYSGMADVAALLGDEAYIRAIDKIWNDVVGTKLYITGGVGAVGGHEGYGDPYYLPNMSAYNETCAAIANVYWNYRLFLLHGESKYYDVLERTLYNGLISGISLSGDRFFYPNPLESKGQHSRSAWFGCACCPSNICRFMPSLPGYVYAQKDNRLYVNLFMSNEATFTLDGKQVSLTQQTAYPWEGDVKITVNPAAAGRFEVAVRIPGWAVNAPVPSDLYRYAVQDKAATTLLVNGAKAGYTMQDGYAVIDREWKPGDVISVSFPMTIHRVVANDKVADDRGKVSLERGPVVYCLEWPDNEGVNIRNMLLPQNAALKAVYDGDLLNGVVTIEGSGKNVTQTASGKLKETPVAVKAIPYYAWANRGRGEMAVWMAYDRTAVKPVAFPTIASQSRLTASRDATDAAAVHDLEMPANSNDHNMSYCHFWPANNTTEWLQYDFKEPAKVSSTEVYWFDDSIQGGGCTVPASWKLYYRSGEEWVEVKAKGEYGTAKDRFNVLAFEPVTTSGLRLEIQLPRRASSGVHEWVVK